MNSLSRFIYVFTFLGVMMTGYAQNLVQNPSFESPVSWDEFWILSMLPPSTVTAIATEITTDAHEGTTSVELSNSDPLSWTYFYTDSVNAPIMLMANQRYEVRAWIKAVEQAKSVELSMVWNNGQDAMVFYRGKPDPLDYPDWFLVKDTITALADYDDGFLSLGFRAEKNGSLPSGKLLVDDISVSRIPSNLTEVMDFSIPEQTGAAVIDKLLQTITLEVPFGTDVTALFPTIDLSLGATINPVGGPAVDFTSPVIYKVTAEDAVTIQDWTVTVTIAPPSTETDILGFDFTTQTGPPTIDNVLHTVITELEYGTNVSSLAPVIELSQGATISPSPGVAVDFSVPVIYNVTAEDGATVQNYIVAAMVSPISNETDIVSFSMPQQAGPAIIDDQLHEVIIEVSSGTDVSALVPTIGISAGASIDPASGVADDFSSPLVYTVTAEDGTTIQDWTTEVIVLPNTDTDIVDITIAEQTGPASIDNLTHTVAIDVPYATDATALVPTIVLPAGASLNPVSGIARDFSVPVVYTVTAEDGATIQDWTVTMNELPNTETDIEDFTLVEQTGPTTIDKLLHTISVDVPYGTDMTAMVPTIGLSTGASCNPLSGVLGDFSSPVVYTVTAEDGITIQDWTTTVNMLPNTETDIEDFVLAEQTGSAIIDKQLHTVSIDVPLGTDLSAMIPEIQLSEGASITPDTGVSVDFSAPVVFRVTADDGNITQDWSVTVLVPFNTETDVLDFTLAEQTGPATISDLLHTVLIDVSYGTDVTALVPSIILSSGASIDPATGVSADFSSSVVYTVTAADGITTQEWMVNVLVPLNQETDIVSFTLGEQTGEAAINNLLHTVELEVAKETDVTTLVPIIVLSDGASISPASDVATDFSSSVVFTVTAEDGVTTQDWSVSLTVDPAVSVETASILKSIQVYPNPAREIIFVELPAKGDIFMQDITGRVVYTISEAPAKTTIPVSELDRGAYFIRVIWDDTQHVSKIILE